jgi:DEAD/DEAH box helicase domain-containing protein
MAIITVPSDQDGHDPYPVDLDTGECSCEHYQIRLKGKNDREPPERFQCCKHYGKAIAIDIRRRSMDHIVLDIEIINAVGDGGITWDDTNAMGVSVAALYEFQSDRYFVYGPGWDDQALLMDRLLRADRITTFNGWEFDLPVIWGNPKRGPVKELETKSDDLIQRIRKSLGMKFAKGYSLDKICEGTLGQKKSGDGAEAPALFKAGRNAELLSYCMDDVRLTRDLCVFIEKYGYICSIEAKARIPLHPWHPAVKIHPNTSDDCSLVQAPTPDEMVVSKLSKLPEEQHTFGVRDRRQTVAEMEKTVLSGEPKLTDVREDF